MPISQRGRLGRRRWTFASPPRQCADNDFKTGVLDDVVNNWLGPDGEDVLYKEDGYSIYYVNAEGVL